MIQQAFDQTEASIIVRWLPLYHDMGLIGNVLQTLYVGARCVLMSPVAFLQSPFSWLQAISVAIEHSSATAFIHWANDAFSQENLRSDRFSTSICFDLSIFEMFVTLNRGGQLVLADNALHLAELPAAREVTLINTVPSAMTELLRMRAVPDSVRVVNPAGEPLTEELVEFLGRADHQVKLRGYGIELGEIESVLRRHEQVQEAIVVARDQEGEEKRLVAYVVAEASARVSELRAWLRERLPEFMTPTAFVMMEALPLTLNGKADRKALPAPDFSVAEESLTAPHYPRERLDYMLHDSGASGLLTPESIRVLLSKEPGIDREPPPAHIDLENLAYVNYTSGSPGSRKGVAVSHGALLNLVCRHNSVFNISASDRATPLAGVSFAASVWKLWPYMSRGASLDLPPDDMRSSPEGLRDWITQRAVTVSFVPTPVAEPMLALEWSSKTKLRTLLTGGDGLHTWTTSSLPFAVVNNLGPTKNAVVSTSGLVRREGGAPGTASTLGRSISNVGIYIVDQRGEPVPVGVIGELWVGGDSLARGYLNRPELSAEMLCPMR